MVAGLLNTVKTAVVPTWVTGPIFDKELRVSSRRRRNYALRFGYLGLLILFILVVWINVVEDMGFGASAATVARMAAAGQMIIVGIVWFQFCAVQLIAVIMLSTSISDEIYHKTLGVLMTTPINSFQIVMGKLFSKLLQLLLLLAISLPILAIVRVFGGVPWRYVVSSLCITLTALIFAASVSMYFSIRSRRAHGVILKTLAAGAVLYALLPWLAFMIVIEDPIGGVGPVELSLYVSYVNPFGALSMNTALMGSGVLPFSFSWVLHCLIMLGASSLILTQCVRVVRKVALRQATGQAGTFAPRRKARAAARTPSKQIESTGRIRRVRGSPVAWKELRVVFLRGTRRSHLIAIAVALITLLVTYIVVGRQGYIHTSVTQAGYVCAFVLLGILNTVIFSAASISTEKESRCWPILLATPLDDWRILEGKAVGVLRKSLPVWFFLGGHVLLFTATRTIHPIATLHLGMLVIWVMTFLTGTGLYFSARFRRTTTAVVSNFALACAIWLVLPLLLGFVGFSDLYYVDLPEKVLPSNPFVQAAVVTSAAAGEPHRHENLWKLHYNWPDGNSESASSTTARMFTIALVYAGVGVLFAWRAKENFRRNVF